MLSRVPADAFITIDLQFAGTGNIEISAPEAASTEVDQGRGTRDELLQARIAMINEYAALVIKTFQNQQISVDIVH